jgi:hypothetical protein
MTEVKKTVMAPAFSMYILRCSRGCDRVTQRARRDGRGAHPDASQLSAGAATRAIAATSRAHFDSSTASCFLPAALNR